MEDRDQLRREQTPTEGSPRPPSRTAKVGTKIITGAAKAIGSFLTRGGIRHPDDLITKGPNRSLYIPSGHPVSPVPGRTPRMDKSLLVGSMDSAPGMQRPRPRPRPGPKSKKRKNTWNRQLAQARRMILG